MLKMMLALWAAWLLALPAHAGVVISSTRVIYPASAPEVTVQLLNRDATPALLQIWLDDGDADADPGGVQVPFVISPAMFRLEAEQGQALRLMYTGEPLPADRESLFWLNMQQIPPRADSPGNLLQVAVRTRIKVMFRPDGLASHAAEAPTQVRWQLLHSDGPWQLEGHNPTPYFVNLGEVNLVVAGRVFEAGAGHVPPFGQARFTVQGEPGAVKQGQVSFIALDDHGAGRRGELALTSP
ncbi:pili assembly chaperone [Pseudomonas sp. M47T1]|uniref:fimbrial biogenesis chaperone n=1 Tax=Pseudomonas sp. M47T1 TaxID=1179778 RepID=UPI000260755E|nr:fimbria/pilus periplasmic chaperone [Pseudomonas sp. M47T1]EIK97089.1 pili assembly chaperone [Pseudomonas sp. M47T1]